MIIMPLLLPTGDSEFHKTYHRLQAIHTGFLPYNSERGAMMKGPNANPSVYTEKVICMTDSDMCRSVAICPSAGATMLTDMRPTRWPRVTIRAMQSLREVGQL